MDDFQIVSIICFVFIFSMVMMYLCVEHHFKKNDTRSFCEKNGHNYAARHSKGASTVSFKIEQSCSARELQNMIELYRPVTYECDICTHCGDIIKKPN